MTTLMSSTNAQLPKISYIKSIDVFLGTCFVMVFGSLLEYAIVGYLGKRIAMRKSRLEQLSKLAEEHRKKCAAAAAAAAAAIATNESGNNNNDQSSSNINQHNSSAQQHQQQSMPTGMHHNQLMNMHPSHPPTLICATTGLPLDPNMQMICGVKTPVSLTFTLFLLPS
jgi:hypothetical protein